MSKAPFWPVATDALIADTMHLTTEEFGAYVKLMIAQWRSGGNPLPNDDSRLSRMAGLTPRTWQKIRATMSDFFEISDDGWSQKRVEKDFASVIDKITKNRTNGSRGGRAKSLKNNKLVLANATISPEYSLEENVSETPTNHNYNHNHNHKEEDTLTTFGGCRGDGKKSVDLFEDRNREHEGQLAINGAYPKPRQARKPPDGFEEFYRAYPRHVGKLAAETAYRVAIARATSAEILAGASRYAAATVGKDRQYIAHPATWLKAGRWADDDAKTNVIAMSETFCQTDLRGWQDRLSEYRRSGGWLPKWGPKPGDAGCRVPPGFLDRPETSESLHDMSATLARQNGG